MIPLLTISSYDINKESLLGSIIVNSAIAVNIFRTAGIKLSGITGGKSKKLQEIIDYAIEQSKKKMNLELKKNYSHATKVIDVKFKLTEYLMQNDTIAYMETIGHIYDLVTGFSGGGSSTFVTPIIIITATGTVVGPK